MLSLFSPKAASLVRLVCIVLLFGLIISSVPISHYQRAHSSGGSRRMQDPPPIPDDLPSLDELRRIKPGIPKAPPPVPATRCRGRDQKCKRKINRELSSNLTSN
jgi:hypothetical protein